MEQIRHKLIAFEGKAKVSRIKAVMKWWTKCISMVIAKTASRNVAFKSDKLMDALFREGGIMQTCILPYKRTTCKIRSLLSVEVCAT